MLLRLGVAIALLGIAACAFDPHGASGDGDASAIDAPDGPPLDGTDASPIDGDDASLIDASPIDGCSPGPERCNGADDDCDNQVDETFPSLGVPCDGLDTDLCLDDAVACNAAGNGVVCDSAAPDDDLERCNGVDDDCDGAVDETFPDLGQLCDGPDGDVCIEGVRSCTADGSGVACDDLTPTTAEICNGIDDDCDIAVDEDFPGMGVVCDGGDGDSCAEGVIECDPATGTLRCGDLTDTTVETCNLADDDCDAAVDEDFDLANDPGNCGGCGRPCTNPAGTTTCAAGACLPSCAVGAQDCDGNPANGCELRNTDPVCSGPTSLGIVRGDTGADNLTVTSYTERVFRAGVTETVNAGGGDIDAQLILVSPPGTNFDLFVTCTACGGATVSSTTPGVDIVNIGRADNFGNQSYVILIEVRWVSSSACGDWTLIVTGNVDTANNTCGT